MNLPEMVVVCFYIHKFLVMNKTVKVSNGYSIHDAYELKDGGYISTKVTDGPGATPFDSETLFTQL